MQHDDSFSSTNSTLDGRPTQESVVSQMHILLSAFERDIDGTGPLIESQEIAGLRIELHASCSEMRDGLTRLSDRTLKLERASTRHEERSARSISMGPSEEKIRVGLNPSLWPKA
jgi:predicted component of type VI protein secretion system